MSLTRLLLIGVPVGILAAAAYVDATVPFCPRCSHWHYYKGACPRRGAA